MSKKVSAQDATINALKGAFRKLSEGLKALTPAQLGVNTDYVQNMVAELEEAYQKLDAGQALEFAKVVEGYEQLHDENASLKAEVQELELKLKEATAVFASLNLIKEMTQQIHSVTVPKIS